MPQVKVGWRSGAVAAPSVSTILLDTYSGASAAYSLRKLSSTYTGSAIRVRRSSDNTELNIGFDSDGNLDTVALSVFVGTGNGFVTTWYDQSGNGRDSSQTTAASQPSIILSGAINTQNNKPSMYFNGSSSWLACSPFTNSTYQVEPFSLISVMGLNPGYSTTGVYCPYGTYGSGQFRLRIINNKYEIYNGSTNLSSSIDVSSGQKIISNIYSGTDKLRVNGVEVISGNSGNTVGTIFGIGRSWWSGWNYNGFIQEFVIYPSDQISNVVGLESSINTYYSAYPNPTSVWNLLAAAYNADATGSSSLKTSLFAAYNGESNANDSFGSNNGTAVGGLTYSTGKIGNAFQFNGTNAYVSLPRTTNQFDFTGDFSISLWFNQSVNGGLFSNCYITSTTNRYGYNLYLQGGRIRFQTYKGNTAPSSATNTAQATSTAINTNTWYHVVVTKTVGNAFKMYINNVLQALAVLEGDLSLTPVYSSSNTVNIGAEQGAYFLNGKIDALNTWTKELTQSEITELYNSGNGAQYIGDNFYKPTTNDALGTNNGTAQGGLTYGLGKVGTAFQFNGSNSLVSLPTNSMKFTGDFSYSFWVNLASLGGYPTLISNYRNAGGDYGYIIRMNPSGKLEFWGFATSTNSFAMASLTTFNTNTWYHVSVTKSASSVKIYVNGVLNITNSVGVPITYFSTMYPSIGALYNWNGSSSADFVSNGSKIDAIGIWNKELSASEVTELYNSGNGKQYPN